jgi:tRNA-splicing ligase RtcB
MRVGAKSAALYVDERIEPDERALAQLRQLLGAPGVVSPVVALPDIHFKARNPAPTGAVVAVEDGVIPLAIDAGINCGMRVHLLDLSLDELGEGGVEAFFDALRSRVPTGWHPADVVDDAGMKDILERGAAAALELHDGRGGPLERIENGGRVPASFVEEAIPRGAWRRGRRGLGVLGGGNHFLELHVVEEVLHEHAGPLGIEPRQLAVILHSGSGVVGKTVGLFFGRRGERSGRSAVRFELEKAEYHLRRGDRAARLGHFRRDGFRRLRADSSEGRRCLAAMAAAANFGYANRAVLGAAVEASVADVFGPAVGAPLLYDVSHNLVQAEQHDGRLLHIHRQGASRALPASRMTHDPVFSVTGQPFPVPGSMGASSYICVARETAAATFYSANHGAGRRLDKPEARHEFAVEAVEEEMARQHIALFKDGAREGIAEQAPGAFKDIGAVLDVMERTGIATAVARTAPLGVLKG